MENKEIVERVLKGEDLSTLIKELPDDRQLEVRRAVNDAYDAEVKRKQADVKKATEDLIGVRKGIDDIKAKNEDKKNDVIETFKQEQVIKAKTKFLADSRFPMTEAQKTEFENALKNKQLASTDADFVFNELKSIYGSLFIDNIMDQNAKLSKNAANAVRFNSGQAGASNSGPTGDPDKYSPAVRELWQKVVESGHKSFTLDQAKEQFDGGRNFSRKLS